MITPIAGANLLVFGLVGADRLGTPGFPDLDRDGTWWSDQGAGTAGAYGLDPNTLDPLVPRFPATGGSYVDDATRSSIRTLFELNNEGIALNTFGRDGVDVQPFFTDAWGRPILYYRANRAGRIIVTNPGTAIGTYDQRDNHVFTGTNWQNFPTNGIDFGPGPVNGTYYSMIGTSSYPGIDPLLDGNGVHDILVNDATYFGTLERFVLDSSVIARNRPINPEKYLLISAGADAIYGTNDDVVNWERR
ncbi:MAG: hypothetical protein IID39_10565 [Planctomycetes bacterium]|nr:hypothetical protein [Planctomycetota bacterium]